MKKFVGFLLLFLAYVTILTVAESLAGINTDFLYNVVISAIFLVLDLIGYHLSQKFDKKNKKKEE